MEITYKFVFENGQKKDFKIQFDNQNMNFVEPSGRTPSAWTELENQKCSHCPLDKKEFPQCPISKNIDTLVDQFKDTKSFWNADVTVETEARSYSKKTDLQTALFSIFGLIMATSPCPYMKFLKPMARFHLPFSTMEETVTRSISMYLLKQYIVSKDGGKPDISLSGLEKMYADLNTVNAGICERIRTLGEGDSQANAVVVLDSFAQMLSIEISSDLGSIRPFFT